LKHSIFQLRKKDEDTKSFEPLNQFMSPPTLEFEYVSGYTQNACDDCALCCMNSGLSSDEICHMNSFKIIKLKGSIEHMLKPLILQRNFLIDMYLMAKMTLIIVKIDINVSVTNIQATVNRDYKYDFLYYKVLMNR